MATPILMSRATIPAVSFRTATQTSGTNARQPQACSRPSSGGIGDSVGENGSSAEWRPRRDVENVLVLAAVPARKVLLPVVRLFPRPPMQSEVAAPRLRHGDLHWSSGEYRTATRLRISLALAHGKDRASASTRAGSADAAGRLAPDGIRLALTRGAAPLGGVPLEIGSCERRASRRSTGSRSSCPDQTARDDAGGEGGAEEGRIVLGAAAHVQQG